jgi:Flp pilus assembly protein TadG
MRVKKNVPGRKNEQGIVITLVAVFVLCVLGAMAALSIDVVTFYTARSEAQLAADGAALAGARVLANSGLTSTAAGPAVAEALATTVATQVATSNSIGGKAPTVVTVTYNTGSSTFITDPHVTVTVQRTDLPTFFARIWGTTQVTVSASATAEAYNPSAPTIISVGGGGPPVAPICVKPWLLPNMDPTAATATGASQIFDPLNGAIVNSGLVGQSWPSAIPSLNPGGLYALCGDCSSVANPSGIPAPAPGRYYPGLIDAADFPAPTQALPACSAGFNAYQLAVAGCVQQPIVCGGASSINIDTTPYAFSNPGGRDADTVQAAECLIHYKNPADSDSIDTSAVPSPPFQFLAGNQNPVAGAVGSAVVVSDSLVTIPVINTPAPPGLPPPAPTNPVNVIGFLQVFLNPSGSLMTIPGPPPNQIPATIINMAGCGASVGTPILGNGASPVAVRLITPP